MTDRGYYVEEPWLPVSESLTEWGQDFHALLLNDQLRMRTFRAAIAEVVRPGAVVVDLGTGTGILAQWALEFGAARVYGIDFNAEVLADATERLAAAGYRDRFIPVRGLSYDIELPEQASVILSETLGNLADNESCVPILADARRRFLAPGGVLLPSKVESYLVPVAATDAHRKVAQCQVRGGDESLSVERQLAQLGAASPFDTYYDAVIGWDRHLATPRLAREYQFLEAETDEYEIALSFTARQHGTLTGFKGYFIADLSPSTAMDISGDDIEAGQTSDSWKHCYLPIRLPIEVRPDDRISLRFARKRTGDGFGQSYRWAGEVHRDSDQVGGFEQSSGAGPVLQDA
ncbi:MAG TPA: class I SAM-dependent methyltransferase [Jatrophihabitans sp.]|jgi:protein arginine N-methyltransferase 1|uniref:methyltransferase domain-containing protein n=1 Tax=Jatrophihabitans sp. TaxID=1932789 RepID=UPI002EFA321F